MSAATQNEMERLRAERDSAVDQVSYWRERAVVAEAERDALEAPAVQADPVAEVRIEKDYWNRGHFYEGWRKELKVGPSIQDLPVGTKLYAAQQPATSLARLKAQWCEDKAAHFMELADNARANGYMAQADAVEDMAQELKDDANKLRRQAEGGE